MGLSLSRAVLCRGLLCLTLGKESLCRVPDIWPSAKPQALGKVRVSSSANLVEAIAAMLMGHNQQTAEQTTLLRQLVQQTTTQRQGNRNHPVVAGYQEFLGTQPPLFHKADEPLEADSWLQTIESKFTLHQYNEGDKATFAAQQLRAPHAHGGIIIVPCCLPAIRFLGLNSRELSERIIFLQGYAEEAH